MHNSDFQSQFSMSKFKNRNLSEKNFLNHFIFKNDIQFLRTLTQLTARLINYLMGLNEGLVECATVCVKSEVILSQVHIEKRIKAGNRRFIQVYTLYSRYYNLVLIINHY